MHRSTSVRSALPRGSIPAAITLAVLAVPFAAMQFSTEVAWDVADFLVMGALVFGTGLAIEWVMRSGAAAMYRGGMALALVTALVMTWANLAVGLLGGESSAANAWLSGVVAVGLAGAALCGLRAGGMAATLLLMAVLHAALTGIAMARGWKPLRHGAIDLWAPNALFVLLFLGAAVLFWVVAEDGRAALSNGSRAPRQAVHIAQVSGLLLIGAGLASLGMLVGGLDDAPGAGAGGLLLLAASGVVAWRVARRGGRIDDPRK